MKTKQSLAEHNLMVVGQAFSDLNRWGTGEEVGHKPDVDDPNGRNALFEHYIKAGGLEGLSERTEIAA